MIPPQLPGPAELGPCLDQLERHLGSVILVAIEQPEVCNFTRCTWAWLSREERKALRRALETARKRREKSHNVDRSDLAAVSEGKDSVTSLENETRATAHTQIGEDRDYYQRMHGLLSYGIATGRTNPDYRLLYDSLGDYLGARSGSDRAAAKKAVNLCLAHGNFDSTDREAVGDDIDDRILTQFESISDSEEQSRFYTRHRAEIHRAFQARKSNNS
jgi:hypothetical protein